MKYEFPFMIGDVIELDFGEGSLVVGKVEGIYDNNRAVPDIDEEIIGTRRNPAVKIQILESNNSGLEETGTYAGFTANDLERVIRV